VGTVIGVVGDGAASPAAPAAPAEAAPPAPAAAPSPAPEPPAAAPTPAAPAAVAPDPAPAPEPQAPAAAETPRSGIAGDQRLLSPVVRRLINEHDLDPDAIPGTGPGGRITRDDVLDHIDRVGSSKGAPAAAPSPAPAAPAAAAPAAAAPAANPRPTAPAPSVAAGTGDDVVALSKIRRLTGEHMIMSKSVSPHAFSVVEIDFANVDVARNAVKRDFKAAEGFGLTYLPFIVRAVVDAIAAYPHLNASVSDKQLIVHKYVDIGVAVDLDYEGLLVPIVRGADGKRLRAIAREISDLATRARTRKLSPDEISGGTFTISNNGSAGSVLTMAIINQPQVAILSTDAIVRKPVVVTAADGSEAIAIHPVGNLAMSWDHRAFDGAYAAGFLVKIKEIIERRDWSAEI
jgi:pyruvate dehydrogenase E2 component (dihydrolipoamide acetyltransferase)